MCRCIVFMLVVVITMCGCSKNEPAPAESKPSPPAKTVAQTPEYLPQYTLTVDNRESEGERSIVSWAALVNTGGWEMNTDNVVVEMQSGERVARVYATLVQPNPGQLTTQAFETLTGRYDAGLKKIDRAELSVKRTTRGLLRETSPEYSVVKRWGTAAAP